MPAKLSPASEELAAGLLVGGAYRVEEVLGEGGVGTVYAAVDERLGRPVALKVIHPALVADADLRRRFLREARVTATLENDHVARLLDSGLLDDGRPYLVLERLTGKDLEQVIVERSPMPIPEVVDIVLQALVGIAAAHAAGLVHRDLKPGNLFLAESPGRPPKVKVLDFGIAKAVKGKEYGKDPSTSTSDVFGTPVYMAPEQLESAKRADRRTDIWSIGVILYEALTGRLPFDGSSIGAFIAAVMMAEPAPIARHRADVPAPIVAAILRCLRREPDARFATARGLAEEIAPFGTRAGLRWLAEIVTIDESETLTRPLASFGIDAARPGGRRPGALAIAGGCFVIVVVVAVALFTLRSAGR